MFLAQNLQSQANLSLCELLLALIPSVSSGNDFLQTFCLCMAGYPKHSGEQLQTKWRFKAIYQIRYPLDSFARSQGSDQARGQRLPRLREPIAIP